MQRNPTNTQRARDAIDSTSKSPCKNCGLQHPKRQCPAFGKQCRNCKKLNYFAKCCRSAKRKVESVEQSEDSPKSNLMFVGAINHSNKMELGADECYTTLDIEGHSVKFKVDTDSQVNILPSSVYRQRNVRYKLAKPTTRLTSYSGEDLKVQGHTSLRSRDRLIDFYIVETTQNPILGLQTSQELGIIKIVLNVDRTNCFSRDTQNYFKV